MGGYNMHKAFKEEKAWWKEVVVYQIYPKSFSDSNGDGIGDIKGIIEKLDYLKALGVDVIWLCPIYKSPNDDNGYDITDYYDISGEFGAMEDFLLLLDEIHSRGLKLIMDMVANHTSDEHPWFVESQKSKDNYYRDFYYWKEGEEGREPNDWLSFFTGSAWEYSKNTEQYYLHLFSKKQPDLNWENPKVREEMHKIMEFWLDMGVDGFRMDAINLIAKDKGLPSVGDGIEYKWGSRYFTNRPKVHDYLQEINEKVLSNYDVMTVGETSEINVEEGIKYSSAKSKELNMVFCFEHMGLDIAEGRKWETKPVDVIELKQIMSRWQIGLENEGWNSIYLGNHDQTRIVSRFGDDKSYRIESAKLLATMMLTLKGTPYLYQGDEISMTNLASKYITDYDDVGTIAVYNELKNDGVSEQEIMERISKRSRDNSRTPMQWDSSKNAGFTDGTPWMTVNDNHKHINAKQSVEDENSVFNYYKKLISFRKQFPVFVYGKYADVDFENVHIYAYTRILEDEKLLIILNFSKDANEFDIPEGIKIDDYEMLLSNYSDQKKLSALIKLKPYEAMILKRNKKHS